MTVRKPQKNFLEMIPVRNVTEFMQESEKIILLIPKFRSEWMRKWLIPVKRSKYFRIHLDEMGSKVWLLIDGERNTDEICNLLNDAISGQHDPKNPLEYRVTNYLNQLFRNRFILFK
jgi:hypothetical protein